MNRQKLDLDKNILIKIIKKGMPVIIIGIALFMFACKSDIEKVNIFATEIDLPQLSAKNLVVEYTDTAKLQMKFITPEVSHYTKPEEPFYEFPKGVEVFFYDHNEELQSTITAKYAKYFDKKLLWEARDSVVAKDVQKGQMIETEHMFLDQNKQLVYSKVFTKITNEDGVYYGEKGFEAAQDLSSYKLLGSSGTVRVKDEEQPESE